MTEEELQSGVIQLARLQGWMVAHFRPAKTEKGWRTPVAGDGKGFPDLVMIRDGRLIFAELKSSDGRIRPDQRAWLDRLFKVVGIEVVVWRPADWPEIVETLAR